MQDSSFEKVERVHKVFIEYFTHDENQNVNVQTRVFRDESKADYFTNTLPYRGVSECSKKVITKCSFRQRSVKEIILNAHNNNHTEVVLYSDLTPSQKEELLGAGFEVRQLEPKQTKVIWFRNPEAINNL